MHIIALIQVNELNPILFQEGSLQHNIVHIQCKLSVQTLERLWRTEDTDLAMSYPAVMS